MEVLWGKGYKINYINLNTRPGLLTEFLNSSQTGSGESNLICKLHTTQFQGEVTVDLQSRDNDHYCAVQSQQSDH